MEQARNKLGSDREPRTRRSIALTGGVLAALVATGGCRALAGYGSATDDAQAADHRLDLPRSRETTSDGLETADVARDTEAPADTGWPPDWPPDAVSDAPALHGSVTLKILSADWACKLIVTNAGQPPIERLRWKWTQTRTVFDYVEGAWTTSPDLGTTNTNNDGLNSADLTIVFASPIAEGATATSTSCDLDDLETGNDTPVSVYAAASGQLTITYAGGVEVLQLISRSAKAAQAATDCEWQLSW